MKKAIVIISIVMMIILTCSLCGCKKNGSSSENESANNKSSADVNKSGAANNEEEEPTYDYLVLVNKENKLPDDWESTVELVKVKNDVGDLEIGEDQEYIRDREFEVEKKAYEAFSKLQKAMADEGVIILLDSTYRSVARQQEIWDEFMEEKGEEYTKKYVAVPGYSEHHTGLAIDICIAKNGKIINDNDEMLKQKKIFAKIHEHLADYGFILRYPDGKDEMTGYSYEPWHLRYVGDEGAAKFIESRDWTLEEYLRSGAYN